MRIVCDGCGAKYRVDDNRSKIAPVNSHVRNGAKIVVRQQETQTEPAAPDSQQEIGNEAFEPTTRCLR